MRLATLFFIVALLPGCTIQRYTEARAVSDAKGYCIRPVGNWTCYEYCVSKHYFVPAREKTRSRTLCQQEGCATGKTLLNRQKRWQYGKLVYRHTKHRVWEWHANGKRKKRVRHRHKKLKTTNCWIKRTRTYDEQGHLISLQRDTTFTAF